MATAQSRKTKPANSALTAADFDTPEIRKDADRLMRLQLNPYQLKLNARLLDRLTAKFYKWLFRQKQVLALQLSNVPKKARQKWLSERFGADRRKPERQAARYLTDFISREVQKLLGQLQELKNDNREFRKTLGAALTELERREVILAYAKTLGSNARDLAEDRRAFERWFDEEAVTDRFVKLTGETELELAFAFERLGFLVDHVVNTSIYESDVQAEQQSQKLDRLSGLWKRLNIQGRILPLLEFDCDARLHVAALRCLRLAAQSLPDELPIPIIATKTLDFVHRCAVEGKADIWLQCESLNILTQDSFEFALPILEARLQRSKADTDDIFVRRHILKLIQKHQSQLPDQDFNPDYLVRDDSPFVRQQAAKLFFLLDSAPSFETWKQFVSDDDPCVRAAALMCIIDTELKELRTNESLTVLLRTLKSETSEFVKRTALHVAKSLLELIANGSTEFNQKTREYFHSRYAQEVLQTIQQLEWGDDSTRVRRWSAQASEFIHVILHPKLNKLFKRLKPRLPTIQVGRTRRFPKSWFTDLSPFELGRLFAVLAQDDFGYDLKRGWFGYRVTRGPQFAFRLWRFLFEVRNAATDKRQGISHCIGRLSTSKLRAQSQILGELSETKVPGEPLTIASDGTWRPFLPLLDDFVSVLNMSWLWPATVSFFSSQGVTRVTGPRSIFRKIRTAWLLSLKFKKYADLRNWDDNTFPAGSYIESLRSMGFRIEFIRYDDEAAIENSGSDASVEQFFRTAGIALPVAALLSQSSIINYFHRFVDYFSAAFENTLEELVVFSVLVLLFAGLKHFWSNYTFRKARQTIPLSIGGWGTRGKSGTERLKAALFGVIGHGVVSKTTGCEAMFIQGYAHGDPIEIPLFRPYDKATVWEQSNLIHLAARLNPSVFLWECMALNPSYVDLLQRQWMQDDLATITNTYPDHEDIQGPAGYNVAQTISCFVPRDAVCISTEQTMRPYVTDECRRMNTQFKGVGWLESGLITSDVLERFPYQEHPDNVALVAAMAGFLEVDYEYALKAMADYLVPDLGVLKTHPVSIVRKRKIEFTNGCSANERFGCMGNWKRLGFDSQDPWQEPCTWITGVVNNRADRVPRSKVFAKIIVQDISADRFFLIGDNLEGLQGFIEEAWQEHAAELSLRDSSDLWSTEFAISAFKQYTWNMRQPAEPTHIVAKLRGMMESILELDDLKDLEIDTVLASSDTPQQLEDMLRKCNVDQTLANSVMHHAAQWKTALSEYQAMLQKIESASPSNADAIEDEFRNLMKSWYFRKLVVIENYFATGEEVLHTIVEETPPGFTNRMMGLQNIKGTGLDFVYRFQAWDMCFESCALVRSKQATQIEKGLQALAAMPGVGQLCHQLLAETVAWCRSSKEVQPFSDLIDQIEQKIELEDGESVEAVNSIESKSSEGRIRRQVHDWIRSTAEQVLDVNDSVRRRDRADVIYDDLGSLRISRQRAISELRKLTKRQKGGWL